MPYTKKKTKDTNIIGIDLGTTNTVVAMMKNGIPTIIRNSRNKTTTPSLVHQKSKNEFLVGDDARPMLKSDPINTIYGSKRLIGRKMGEIRSYVGDLPYKTTEVCNGDVWIKTNWGKYSPAQIGAKILNYVKKFTEKYIGTNDSKTPTVRRAVVTVPAYFNDSQRQATKDAGKIAGLDVMRVINEPTAAALAYGLEKKTKGNVAVYDLGGGTFDISILELDNGIFHVKSTNGDTFLGGEDFDNEFVNFLVNAYHQKEDIEIKSTHALSRLKVEAERAKRDLSTKKSTNVYVDNIIDGVDFDMDVTREQLESVVKKVAMRTIDPCERAIKDAGIKKKDINKVILVGGMTRMPYVRKLVGDIFKRDPSYDVDPDEVVAKGAAIQAGILSGTVDDAVLLDVIPLSLGIETMGGIFNKIVSRNTTIPFRQEETFTTSEDDQTEVDIRIYQGERSLVSENKSLGKITLKNIPRAKRGVPQIKVIFTADANGLLQVYAIDEKSKKQVHIEIKADSGLTEEEISRMIQDATENEETDQKRIKMVDLQNAWKKELDRLITVKLPEHIHKSIEEFRRKFLRENIPVEEFDATEGINQFSRLTK